MKKVVNENQKSTLRKVLRYIRRYWGYLGASIILAAVTVALTLYLPILIGQAVDQIGKGAVDFAGIFVILRKMAVIIGLTAVAQWVMNACNNKITYNVIRDIRTEAFEKIEKLPLKYLDAHSYGEIVSRVIADVDQFADGLVNEMYPVLYRYRDHLRNTDFHADDQRADHGGGAVVITPVSLFVASSVAKKTFSMFKLQSETRGEQTAFIEEMVGNQKVVQAFSHEDEALEKFDEINERLQKYSLRAIFFEHYQPVDAFCQQPRLRDGRRCRSFYGDRRRNQCRTAVESSVLREPVYEAVQRDFGRHHGASERACMCGQSD